jgi:hypothetical protein
MALQKHPTADESEWIARLLEFVNHPKFTTQQEVYQVFFSRPHPFLATHKEKIAFIPLPPAAGVGPFLNDQKQINALLDGLATRKAHATDRAKELLEKHLNRALDAVLRVGWKRGELRLNVEPKLTGIEASIYYPLALLFHYQLERRVRICEAVTWKEPRRGERWLQEVEGTKEKRCGSFYVTNLNDARRNGCSSEHSQLVAHQKAVRRVQKHRDMEFQRRPLDDWSRTPAPKSDKTAKARNTLRRKRR